MNCKHCGRDLDPCVRICPCLAESLVHSIGEELEARAVWADAVRPLRFTPVTVWDAGNDIGPLVLPGDEATPVFAKLEDAWEWIIREAICRRGFRSAEVGVLASY